MITMTERLPAVAYVKMRELPFVFLPGNINLRHLCARRTAMAPADNLFDFFLLALEHGLDGPVRKIYYPAGDTNAICFILGALPEPDSLDKAMNDHLRAKSIHQG